ncbi:hypothetical protein [Spartinivicinus poritis]|uniref:Uncharacterized protein n=1 Tax=Spartinivicinus poritis TaxID=2994640 RepID=A0ABT5U955_9GAMM|nr:hypothetical protein [Spartinivicinus sp. A2-2]MDE1462907.1 hypothetical protein [Spartinivicinus sp. A2-2]
MLGSKVSNGNVLVPNDFITQLGFHQGGIESGSLTATGLLNEVDPNNITDAPVESFGKLYDNETGELIAESVIVLSEGKLHWGRL